VSSSPDVRDVIIIGSGPAGYTAAVYAARGNLRPLVFEGSVTAGGALMTTTDVENFPGFPDGIMGPDLMDNLRRQAERFGAELVADDIEAVDLTGPVKSVTDGSGAVHLARTVIIATGSKYRALGLDNEARLAGRGVSSCATCDGFFFREHDIAVVGGGDSALEAAASIAELPETKVALSYRGEAFDRAKAKNRDRVASANKSGKLNLLLGSKIQKIDSQSVMVDLRGEPLEISNDAVIVSAGGILPTEFLKSVGIEVATKYGTR